MLTVNNSFNRYNHLNSKNKTLPKSQPAFKGFKGVFESKIDKFIAQTRKINAKDLRKTLEELKLVDKATGEQIEQQIKKLGVEIQKEGLIEFGNHIPFIGRAIKAFIYPIKALCNLSEQLYQSIKNNKPDKTIPLDNNKILNEINEKLNLFKNLRKQIKGNLEGENLKKMQNTFGEKLFENISTQKQDMGIFSVLNKVMASSITALFLASDQYNLTIKQTNGDTKQAKTNTKQRLLQDATRVLFSTWIISSGIDLFRGFNNSSLKSMSIVTIGTSLIYETLTRTAVGVPFIPMSKAKIEEYENKIQNLKGPFGSFFRFVAKATGKKSLSERQVKKSSDSNQQNSQPKVLNDKKLSKFI